MRAAFLTEMGFRGKIPPNHPNMRTEFAWMFTLKADHYNIHDYGQVKNYDAVFIIFPKGMVKLNAFGVEMTPPVGAEKDLSIYASPIVEVLKTHNKKVCFVQEGPHWLFNDYDMDIQFHFYNRLSECDVIFAHNQSDMLFYDGMFPKTKVSIIPTLMIAPTLYPLSKTIERKAIIGGNFARWYGGFQSYIVASTFDCPIYVLSSHCKRIGEDQVPNLHHLPWMNWTQWMQMLSSFQYAVNLMPTVAAGTFSMNCAYWGIPCIGNINVETQVRLFPDFSVDDYDVAGAMLKAEKLKDESYYKQASEQARNELLSSWHFNQERWLTHMESVINE